jgi:hypothetical protein
MGKDMSRGAIAHRGCQKPPQCPYYKRRTEGDSKGLLVAETEPARRPLVQT